MTKIKTSVLTFLILTISVLFLTVPKSHAWPCEPNDEGWSNLVYILFPDGLVTVPSGDTLLKSYNDPSAIWNGDTATNCSYICNSNAATAAVLNSGGSPDRGWNATYNKATGKYEYTFNGSQYGVTLQNTYQALGLLANGTINVAVRFYSAIVGGALQWNQCIGYPIIGTGGQSPIRRAVESSQEYYYENDPDLMLGKWAVQSAPHWFSSFSGQKSLTIHHDEWGNVNSLVYSIQLEDGHWEHWQAISNPEKSTTDQ